MQSSPVRSFIADDESAARTVIKDYIAHSFPDVIVVGEATSVKQAITLIQDQRIDLLFLDVQLEDGTGFQLLDQLPDLNFNVIFTTAYNEFAIRAFRYNAIDYLLKPIDPDEFVTAVQKAREHKNQEVLRRQYAQLVTTTKENSFERITLSTSEGQIFTKTNDIIRIETYGNYSFVFLAQSERLLVSKNLKEFEEMLPAPDFFRVHQSHIVNTGFVQKYIKDEGGYVIMSDNAKIPISRRRKEEFISALKK